MTFKAFSYCHRLQDLQNLESRGKKSILIYQMLLSFRKMTEVGLDALLNANSPHSDNLLPVASRTLKSRPLTAHQEIPVLQALYRMPKSLERKEEGSREHKNIREREEARNLKGNQSPYIPEPHPPPQDFPWFCLVCHCSFGNWASTENRFSNFLGGWLPVLVA